MGTAEYRGWRLTSVNEARTVPKSVRDNPGLVPSGVRRLPALHRRKVMDIVHNIEAALVFAFIGIAVFVAAFVDHRQDDAVSPVEGDRRGEEPGARGARRRDVDRHLHHHRGRRALSPWRSRCSSRSCSSPRAGSSTSSSPARWRAIWSATASSSSRRSSAPTCSRWGSAAFCRGSSARQSGAAVRPDRDPHRGGRRLLVERAVPGVRVHAGVPAAPLPDRAGASARWSASKFRC